MHSKNWWPEGQSEIPIFKDILYICKLSDDNEFELCLLTQDPEKPIKCSIECHSIFTPYIEKFFAEVEVNPNLLGSKQYRYRRRYAPYTDIDNLRRGKQISSHSFVLGDMVFSLTSPYANKQTDEIDEAFFLHKVLGRDVRVLLKYPCLFESFLAESIQSSIDRGHLSLETISAALDALNRYMRGEPIHPSERLSDAPESILEVE